MWLGQDRGAQVLRQGHTHRQGVRKDRAEDGREGEKSSMTPGFGVQALQVERPFTEMGRAVRGS